MKQKIFKTLIVDEKTLGERLDRYLASQVKDVSRSKIQELIKSKNVLLNGKLCQGKEKVANGDEISLLKNPSESVQIKLKEFPCSIDIIYEDEALIVVNKPFKISVHPSISGGPEENTLVEALLTHAKDHSWQNRDLETLRPGIVHRLDKDTTGVIVWAKNQASYDFLSKQFQDRTTEKTYLALLLGDFPEGKLKHESYLKRDPKNKTRFVSLSGEGLSDEQKSEMRWAKSYFTLKENFAHKYSLCEILLVTGRTHQIRVQAKELGHPVLGDQTYNPSHTVSPIFSEKVREVLVKTKRQMLHASKLSFVHPLSHKTMNFEASLPKDFSQLLETLRQN